MSTHKITFLCCALLVLHTTAAVKIHGLKVETCKPKITLATQLLEKAIEADLSLAAAFVRAAFHDCITVRPNHKGAGCNGSLRLRTELSNRRNRGLDQFMTKIEPIVRKTCISNADSLQLGVELSMKLTGGPEVHLGTGRVDSETADPLDGELPGLDSFDVLKEFFGRKGFSVQDMVASDIGGHALGRFFGRPFTSEPNKFDNNFAVHVLRVSEGKSPLPGFNLLSSDLAMTRNEEGKQWVENYADPSTGLKNLKHDFKTFLEKQSKLLIK